MNSGVNIYSEIGRLKKVMLHRLGREIEGLVPDNFERLLFDEIPFLEVAQQEHDCFANVLRKNQVEVVYLQDEVAKSLVQPSVRSKFIAEFLRESDITSPHVGEILYEYLMELPLTRMVETLISGITKEEIPVGQMNSLADFITKEYLYYTDPMPNLYFTRDPGACIGNGVSVHCMSTKARRRESLFLKYICEYNENLIPRETPNWFSYEGPKHIEGGDILVLSPEVLAVGYSQRTSPEAIEILAENLLNHASGFQKVLVFEIPKCRAFMHLDTVFTMVDYDQFTIHPEIEEPLQIYEVTLDKDHKASFHSITDKLDVILKHALKLPAVRLIRCGGTDKLAAQREQWSDGSNTLAIAPGMVITYDRNQVTNELLDKSGIQVLQVPSSELSRGRGGPRCMSMPIYRESC